MSVGNVSKPVINPSGPYEPGGETTAAGDKSANLGGHIQTGDSSCVKNQTAAETLTGKEENIKPKSVPPEVPGNPLNRLEGSRLPAESQCGQAGSGGQESQIVTQQPVVDVIPTPQGEDNKAVKKVKEKSGTGNVPLPSTADETPAGIRPAKVENKKQYLYERFQRGVGKVQEFYKSDFFVFMAYTTLSAFVGGVFGALLTVYVPRYIGLDNGTTKVEPGPAPSPTTCPYEEPKGYEDKITKMNEALDQCLADQKTYNESIKKLTKFIGSVNENVSSLDTGLSSMKTETQENYTMLTQNVMLKNFVVESQISELKEVFVSKEWLFIILLMGLFEVAVIGVVWVMWQKLTDSLRQKLRGRTENVANGRPSHAGGGAIQGDQNVLRKVTPCRLENRVCVVSFHSETVDKHRAKVKDILSGNEATKYVSTVQFLVTSHDDILQMPPAKLYLVFVDFNERNVILEDPNKGLGDLRLTTIQTIDKMGADAMLTYCRDQGSKSLKTGDLYNPDLSSVRQHSELRRLDGRERMLSVFETFNKTQTDHIVKVVRNVVK